MDGMKLSLPVGLLFDMDGVLLDSEDLHRRAKEEAFRHFGITVDPALFDRYKGRPDRTMAEDVVRAAGGDEARVHEVLAYKHEVFRALEHTLAPVAGARDFLAWAEGRFRLALATSATPRNRYIGLAAIRAEGLFASVVDSERVSEPKPAPEVFQVAMRDLGLGPEQCWVVEDSLNGVRAGKAAGCTVVAITTTFAEPELWVAGADAVVASFAGLRALLENL